MEDINGEFVLYVILLWIFLENILELYISYRQVNVYIHSKSVPKELEVDMTKELFHKARIYGLDKQQFSIFKTLILDMIVLSLELYLGLTAFLWEQAKLLAVQSKVDFTSEIIVSCFFFFLMSVYSMVKKLPFRVYNTFTLEEKHGFNKQTAKFFVIDQLKEFFVSQLIATPIVATVVFIVQRAGEYFFYWLWIFTLVITLLMLNIYPIFIAPLFDKYTPLEDGLLKNSIKQLASSLKFPLTKIYLVEGSKRSSHSNAYLYGLWNSKRIVLFDTLLLNKGKKDDSDLETKERGKGCTNEEVLAVLGHELGHWKLGHVFKNIIITQVYMFIMCVAFAYLFQFGPFYEAVGFDIGEKPILVGLNVVLTYVMSPLNTIINFGTNMVSRKFEYEADEFAQKLGFSKQLRNALMKLHMDNLGFPEYDWLYSSWNHSHPTLLQRLQRLKELDTRRIGSLNKQD